jgi:hypothetical protein
MTDPCTHSDAEHHLVNVCEEVIHYPSEDYPCMCTGFAKGSDGSCGGCQHAAAKHVDMRICRPATGEFCTCRSVIA